MTDVSLNYRVLPGDFAVCRLDPATAEPDWVRGERFVSVTRTAEELSIICSASVVPEGVRAESGWRLLKIEGPLPFDAVGVLVRFVTPLAQAGIPILSAATFDTDYVLVRQTALAAAEQALQAAGHHHVA